MNFVLEFDFVVRLLIAVAATRYLAILISEMNGPGDIFISLRTYLKDRSEFLYQLVSCPFCLSFWLAFLFIGLALYLDEEWYYLLAGPFGLAGLALWDRLADDLSADEPIASVSYNENNGSWVHIVGSGDTDSLLKRARERLGD